MAGQPRKPGLLLTTSLVSSLIMLDSNIVAVSLPAIGRSLNASFTDIEWVVSAYVLAYSGLLLAAGSFADLYGRKMAMLIGLAVFAVASGACGLATSSLILNIARAVQGAGGSLLLTASLAIISHNFVGAERARAFAFWGASLGIALTAGPIVGGAITNYLGWRWVFLVNLPICVGLVIASWAIISESRDPQAKRLDWVGILAFTPGLFLLIWALIDGTDAGWRSPSILTRLGGAIALFTIFGALETRLSRPMVDLSLFKRPTFLGSVFAMMGYGGSAQVMVFYLPLFLQNAYGMPPAKAGLAMIPFAVPMVLAPRLSATTASRFSGRTILAVGLSITFCGNILFWLVARSGLPYPVFLVSMLVAGTGAGLLNGKTVQVLESAVPEERAGMASGLASTTRFLGILLSLAVLGAILSSVAHRSFVTAAASLGLDRASAELAAKQVTAGNLQGTLSTLPAGMQNALQVAGLSSFSQGFAAASLFAACIAAVASVLTVLLVCRTDTSPAKMAEKMGNARPAAVD
jgi:EmrB/QacA subfamily drug resistance transporter